MSDDQRRAQILEDVAASGHPYASTLAARKLGELLDQIGGLARFDDDLELARMMRADAEGEALGWLDPR